MMIFLKTENGHILKYKPKIQKLRAQYPQLSKCVHKGFQKVIKLKSMSERMRKRFNSGSFVKYHGKQSSDGKVRFSDLNNRSEDMVCEWLVAKVKNSFKTLGGNFTEETVDIERLKLLL